MESKPVLRFKTIEILKRNSRRASQPGRTDTVWPDSSTSRPTTAQASKPSPPDPFLTTALTSASIQEGASESEPPETDPEATKSLWGKVEQVLRKQRGANYRMPLDNKPTRSSAAKVSLSIDPPSSKAETATPSKQLAKARAYECPISRPCSTYSRISKQQN